MNTVTIPKKLAQKGDLVLIPLEEYEELLLGKKGVKTFKPTAAIKRALKEAEKQVAKGEYYTLEELEHELERHRR